ncbi:hypothetical protein Acor_31580 [Acrocarpospora corrugata]|uniref:Uncharacterized protein n=1 Tax=Acrocarpospora corrugata TaxID=35763 RepID=A0A5M3VXD0_9ACTN|nr:hypothetical protein [Acrocarpospora corrugata]GES01094.1 hypothetical protein Acor_31580 [Acrocarpospora corrugata]
MSPFIGRAAAAFLVLAAAVMVPSPVLAADPVLQSHPLPELRPKAALLDLAAPEQNQIWIVGYQALKPGYPGNPVVHRWNGRRWAGFTIPNFSSRGVLSSVNATTGGEVWIGGTKNGAAYMAHLVNGAFVQVPAPPGLTSAAPEHTPSGLWVPGIRTQPGASTIWRLEGTAWVPHSMPMQRVLALKGISAEAWAVGNAPGEDDSVPGVAHYTGSAWENVPYPAPFSEGSTLEDVLPRTSDDIWVVGTNYTRGEPRPTEPLLSRYDGSTWTTVALPPEIIGLQSIAQDASGKVWISALALSPAEGAQQRPVVIGTSPDSIAWTVQEVPSSGEFAVHHEGRDNLGIELTTSRLWLLSDIYPAGPALFTGSLLP